MSAVFVRTFLLYAFVIATMRIMGKRLVGQMQPYELAIVVIIADMASVPMNEMGIPLLHGFVPILALAVLHSIIMVLSAKFQWFRQFVSGKPTMLISRGVVQLKELKRLGISLSDLLEECRGGGAKDTSEVYSAVLETNGKLNIFLNAQSREVTPADINLDVQEQGLPITLILDGSLQNENMTLADLSPHLLSEQLARLSLASADVLIATVNTDGQLFVQDKAGALYRVPFIAPEQVRW